MADAKVTRAELAEAVRELREEVARLRAERAAHACHGHGLCCSHVHCNWGHCWCSTFHSYTYPLTGGSVPWYGTVTVSCGETVGGGTYASSAVGCAVPQARPLSLSN